MADVWADWSTTAASNTPVGSSSPFDLHDQLQNIKAQVKGNCADLNTVQDGGYCYAVDAVGTDSYLITLTPTLTAYANGQMFVFKPATANTGGCTLAIDALAATAIKKYSAGALTALVTGDILANQKCLVVYDSDGACFELINPAGRIDAANIGSGDVSTTEYDYLNGVTSAIQTQISGITSARTVQTVYTLSSAKVDLTTALPYDDTIPQITEGDEVMTRTITPADAANLLKIEVIANVSAAAAQANITVALFVGATANALAAATETTSGNPFVHTISFTHWVLAGGTSELTFRVRAGEDGVGDGTFNGLNGSRKLGGVASSSITVTEYRV